MLLFLVAMVLGLLSVLLQISTGDWSGPPRIFTQPLSTDDFILGILIM